MTDVTLMTNTAPVAETETEVEVAENGAEEGETTDLGVGTVADELQDKMTDLGVEILTEDILTVMTLS